jgi:hypothetical protein
MNSWSAVGKFRKLCGLLMLQTGKEAEFHQGSPLGIVSLLLVKRLVDGQDLVHSVVGDQEVLVKPQSPSPATALDPTLASSPFDQDVAHRLGRGGEEVSPTIPVLRLVLVDETDVGFVDQGRGLQGLTGLLLRQPLGR